LAKETHGRQVEQAMDILTLGQRGLTGKYLHPPQPAFLRCSRKDLSVAEQRGVCDPGDLGTEEGARADELIESIR
jgi:hypothetical protein